MVNLVLQQRNSGCAVFNGPGNECLTVPIVVFFQKSIHLTGGEVRAFGHPQFATLVSDSALVQQLIRLV